MLTKFFDTLANMGIWIRLNDSRTEPPGEVGRVWGPAVEGFAVSLSPLSGESVSVLIKNTTSMERRAILPGWLRYLELSVTAPGGGSVALKPYGKNLLASAQASSPVERVFAAGKHLSTEIPVGALFDLRAKGEYVIRVSCAIPGAHGRTLTSNDVTISI